MGRPKNYKSTVINFQEFLRLYLGLPDILPVESTQIGRKLKPKSAETNFSDTFQTNFRKQLGWNINVNTIMRLPSRKVGNIMI